MVTSQGFLSVDGVIGRKRGGRRYPLLLRKQNCRREWKITRAKKLHGAGRKAFRRVVISLTERFPWRAARGTRFISLTRSSRRSLPSASCRPFCTKETVSLAVPKLRHTAKTCVCVAAAAVLKKMKASSTKLCRAHRGLSQNQTQVFISVADSGAVKLSFRKSPANNSTLSISAALAAGNNFRSILRTVRMASVRCTEMRVFNFLRADTCGISTLTQKGHFCSFCAQYIALCSLFVRFNKFQSKLSLFLL